MRIIASLLLLGIILSIAAFNIPGRLSCWLNPGPVGTVRVDRFRDLNEKHLKHARKLGIEPFRTKQAFLDATDSLVSEGKLVRVKDSRWYVIERLTHSHPYLVPEAAQLLEDIGRRFREKLKAEGKARYYFKVTSLLRTRESQKALGRSNVNASGNSTHLYATTFDIAYSKVVRKPLPWIRREVADAPVIRLLSEAIGELRRECRCLVVTEKQERCFHITVCAPISH